MSFPIYPSQLKTFKQRALIWSEALAYTTSAPLLSAFKRNDELAKIAGYKGHADLVKSAQHRAQGDRCQTLRIFHNPAILSAIQARFPNQPNLIGQLQKREDLAQFLGDDFPQRLHSQGFSHDQCTSISRMVQAKNGLILVGGHANSGRKSTAKLIEQANKYCLTHDPLTSDGNSVTRHLDRLHLFQEAGLPRQWRERFKLLQNRHKVISAFYVDSIPQVIPRLIHLLKENGMPPEQMKTWPIAGVICQHLSPIVCPNCCLSWGERFNDPRVTHLYEPIRTFPEYLINQSDRLRVINPDGCSHCAKGVTAYTANPVVYTPDADYLKLALSGHSQEAHAHLIQQQGKNLTQQIIRKALDGIVSPLETLQLLQGLR